MLPVIQGTADVSGKLTQAEISKTVDFCFHAFEPAAREEREDVLRKLEGIRLNGSGSTDAKAKESVEELEAALSADELRILTTIRARQMIRSEDTMNIDSFSADVIDGMAANLQRGDLGLVNATVAHAKGPDFDVLALLTGEEVKGVEEVKEVQVPITAH